MKNTESAKLRGLRAHVPTSFACLRAYMLTCLACLRAFVPMCHAYSRAFVPMRITCLRARGLSRSRLTCLTCSRVNVPLRCYVFMCYNFKYQK